MNFFWSSATENGNLSSPIQFLRSVRPLNFQYNRLVKLLDIYSPSLRCCHVKYMSVNYAAEFPRAHPGSLRQVQVLATASETSCSSRPHSVRPRITKESISYLKHYMSEMPSSLASTPETDRTEYTYHTLIQDGHVIDVKNDDSKTYYAL